MSLVSVGISLWCFGDCGAYSASGVLVYLLVFLCGALMTVVPLESLASIGASVSLVTVVPIVSLAYVYRCFCVVLW